jgi:hypothetical protein
MENSDMLNEMPSSVSNQISNNSLSVSSDSFDNSSSSFFDGFYQIPSSTILIILVICMLLGINVFFYMSKGSDYLLEFTTPILDTISPLFMEIITSILDLFGNISKTAVELFAKANTAFVNTSAKEINKSVSSIQTIGKPPKETASSTSIKYEPVASQSDEKKADAGKNESHNRKSLNIALNQSSSNTNSDYVADDSTSSLQNNISKGGWCFIGEDAGIRTCGKVGLNDTCMSGDIFPSNEICVNPNLRS